MGVRPLESLRGASLPMRRTGPVLLSSRCPRAPLQLTDQSATPTEKNAFPCAAELRREGSCSRESVPSPDGSTQIRTSPFGEGGAEEEAHAGGYKGLQRSLNRK